MRKFYPHRRRFFPPRGGSLVIECVVAAVLIATASLAMTQMAKQAIDLNQQANQRLAAKLTAENLLERLRNLPADRLEAESGSIASETEETSLSAIEIAVTPFESGDHRGLHLRVQVDAAPNARVTLHDWRLTSEVVSAVEDQDAAEDAKRDSDLKIADPSDETPESETPESETPESETPESETPEAENPETLGATVEQGGANEKI